MGPTFHLQERADWLTLYNLIGSLNPAQRIRWLAGCCRLASRGCEPVKITASKGEHDEVWWDYRSVAGAGELTVDRAGNLACRIRDGR